MAQIIVGLSRLTSTLSPVINNPDFLLGVLDWGFKHWDPKGISTIGNLLENGVLINFNQIVQICDFPPKNLCHFFLMVDHIKKKFSLLTDINMSTI